MTAVRWLVLTILAVFFCETLGLQAAPPVKSGQAADSKKKAPAAKKQKAKEPPSILRQAAEALNASNAKLSKQLLEIEKSSAPKTTDGSHGDERAVKILREASAQLKKPKPALAGELDKIILKLELGE